MPDVTASGNILYIPEIEEVVYEYTYYAECKDKLPHKRSVKR